ncbi:reticulon-like protein B3 [Olea europaea var. sylvestris]|uniref:reticulon-like protein B3 n=1 Tax=Olea europaea var. sylvestris TaxID=158386 RepID=UPI000C1D4F63|nr:reticulon-like protein B3 [Olea europaea var. sylvestris]
MFDFFLIVAFISIHSSSPPHSRILKFADTTQAERIHTHKFQDGRWKIIIEATVVPLRLSNSLDCVMLFQIESLIEAMTNRSPNRVNKIVHRVFSSSQVTNALLRRDKKFSTKVLVFASTIWIIIDKHRVRASICDSLMLTLTILFVWSRDAKFLNAVIIPEEPVLKLTFALRNNINSAFATLHYTASGKDVKKFFFLTFGLLLSSKLCSCCDFFTLLYLPTLLLLYAFCLHECEDLVTSNVVKNKNYRQIWYVKIGSKSRILVGCLISFCGHPFFPGRFVI